MPSANLQLPKFKNPPLIEVVCGVQYEAPAGFGTVHVGKFWERVRAEYPSTEDQPPLGEVFESPEGVQARVQAVIDLLPPVRRVFFKDPSDNYILQLQPTRFLANWRKIRPSDEYPRFTTARSRFNSGWASVLALLADSGLARPKVNQYELTYINHIEAGVAGFPAELVRFLTVTATPTRTAFLPSPKSVTMRESFGLRESKGALHVTVSHGVRPTDNKQVLILELTARGPGRTDAADMAAWFDVAHEYIVRGFADLTTKEAHSMWGREQ